MSYYGHRLTACTARCCAASVLKVPRRVPSQVYRAVRNSVQDAAVKLLTNVDAAQLATFSQVSSAPSLCSTPFLLR